MLPSLKHGDALLLGFDGTLVEASKLPDEVFVPPELPGLLARWSDALEGALCVFTARSLNDIRRFIPKCVDVCSEHGGVFESQGTKEVHEPSWPIVWESALDQVEDSLPGLIVDRKHSSISLDFRLNPLIEPRVISFAQQLCNRGPHGFRVVASDKALEIMRTDTDRGRAVQDIMARQRYANKRPIYVGNKSFDIPAFKVVARMQGFPLQVANAFGGRPSAVLSWLKTNSFSLAQ